MQYLNLILRLILFRLLLSTNSSLLNAAPCDIIANKAQTSRVEFDENASAHTRLFELPFNVSTPSEIRDVKFKSNELNETVLSQYFEIVDMNKFMLKSTYDLDVLEIDLIELLFTCTVANSQLSNSFLLYVTINDVNDNAPEFVGTPYEFSVKELTQVGTIVYQNIEALDRDLPNKPNSQISFSILEGPCSSYFGFPLTTKSDLAVTKLIRYDQLSKCELTIKVEDHGNPALSSTTQVEISIIDIDDKDPAFMNSFYSGLIKRNSLPGSFLNMTPNDISAYDQDIGINATIKYSLRSNPNDLFEINTNTGKISLKNAISSNDKSEYGLIVKAYQENNPARSALTMVNVEILSVNEYPPVFEKNLYEIKVKENTKPGTLIGRVQADDRDKNKIEYQIINNHESPFLIDKHKGIILVNGRLDYELKTSYLLDVLASDGNFSSQSVVRIDIVNTVDKEPYFELNNYIFKLKVPYDVYIGQVRAIDVENTNSLKYSLKFDDSNDSGLFCISQNGIIYICPLTSTTTSTTRSQNDSSSDESDLKLRFKKSEYKFNVSVAISSKDLPRELENHVECRIELELNEDYEVNATSRSILKPAGSNLFSESFFKETSSVYVLCGVLITSFVLVTFCAAGVVWFKCQKRRKIKKAKRSIQRYGHHHRHDQCEHYFHSKAPFRNMFNTINDDMDKHKSGMGITNACYSNSSSSSISDHSCKNSTSGISCLSDGSTILSKTCTNHSDKQRKSCDCSFKISGSKALDYLKWQEKNRISPPSMNVDTCSESTPASKLTILSEYFANESQYIKSAKLLNEIEHARSSSSDIMSSSSSTLKNRKNPILVRQESANYENHHSDTSTSHTTHSLTDQSRPRKKRNDLKRISTVSNEFTSSHSSFKPASSSRQTESTLSSSSSSSCNSPKQSVLLSFQPTEANLEKNRNMFSFVYNYHEPLSDTCETNLDNNEKTYEDIKTLTRSVNLKRLDEKEETYEMTNNDKPYIDIEPISDSSFVSVTVDKFSDEKTSNSIDSLSEVTPLSNESMHSQADLARIELISTSSFSSLSQRGQSPQSISLKSIQIKFVKLDDYDSIAENETLV